MSSNSPKPTRADRAAARAAFRQADKLIEQGNAAKGQAAKTAAHTWADAAMDKGHQAIGLPPVDRSKH